jgi:hypothetical protein
MARVLALALILMTGTTAVVFLVVVSISLMPNPPAHIAWLNDTGQSRLSVVIIHPEADDAEKYRVVRLPRLEAGDLQQSRRGHRAGRAPTCLGWRLRAPRYSSSSTGT